MNLRNLRVFSSRGSFEESLSSNEKIAKILIHDTQIIVGLMKGKYVYNSFSSTWFKWLENYYCWREINVKFLNVEVEDLMLKNAKKFQNEFKVSNTIKIAFIYVSRSTAYLELSEENIKFKPGKNYLDGFLQDDDKKLYGHTSKKFVIEPATTYFNKNKEINST